MTTPTLTPYIDQKSGMWYVALRWPATAHQPPMRKRLSLGLPATADPTAAVAEFEAAILPAYIAEHQARERAAVEAADAPERKPAGRAQGPHLRDVAAWYLDTHLRYNGAARKTVEYYSSSIWNFVNWAATRRVGRSGQLSTRLLEEWQIDTCRAKGRELPSREQVLHVRRWLRVAQERGQIPELPNIQWNIPRKKKGKQHKAHPRETISAWLNALSAFRPHAGLIAQWVAASGWRISDALDFRIGEIDHTRGRIERTQIKTSAGLPYPLTPALRAIIAQALKRHTNPQPTDYLFLNHKRRPWTYPQLYRVLQTFHQPSHWTGPSITFRDLRKSFGTHLALEGCPPNVLKELMGHSDIAMTLGYYVDVDLNRMAEWSTHHTQAQQNAPENKSKKST